MGSYMYWKLEHLSPYAQKYFQIRGIFIRFPKRQQALYIHIYEFSICVIHNCICVSAFCFLDAFVLVDIYLFQGRLSLMVSKIILINTKLRRRKIVIICEFKRTTIKLECVTYHLALGFGTQLIQFNYTVFIQATLRNMQTQNQ